LVMTRAAFPDAFGISLKYSGEYPRKQQAKPLL